MATRSAIHTMVSTSTTRSMAMALLSGSQEIFTSETTMTMRGRAMESCGGQMAARTWALGIKASRKALAL